MDLLVIDLDGTITKSDNLIEFSHYMIIKERKVRFLLIFPLRLLLKLKLISNVKFKILFSLLILRNQSVIYLKKCVDKFINLTSFQDKINPNVLRFIDEYKDSNKLILSANYSFIVENIARFLNINTSLAIKLEVANGKYTGIISGKIPYGKEKITVLLSYINLKCYNKTIGISDTKSDLHILKYLDEGYVIKINKKTNETILIKV